MMIKLEKTPYNDMWGFTLRDVSVDIMRKLRGIISNSWMDSDDYKARKRAHPFIQGYEEDRGGWMFVEFWTDDKDACQAYVDYLNGRLA